ncbi:hypothetical protein V8Z80_08595 [Orrella sp. JC864]|uniref:hypothetical protein n=1 Tax=Orrella sp. JC864 TaxID=3120298 RepID=UPI00300A4BAA
MALVEISRAASTSGGVWTALASGPVVLTSIAATNRSSQDTPISVCLRRGSARITIVPEDLLPGGQGSQSTRLRLPVFPLLAGDAVEVRSQAAVDWRAMGAETISSRQFSLAVQAGADAWATIVDQAATVSGLLAANLSMGDAVVSVRISRSGGGESWLVAEEVVEEGASRRLVPVAVLGAGDVLQVRARGAVHFIATGVYA